MYVITLAVLLISIVLANIGISRDKIKIKLVDDENYRMEVQA